MDSFFMTGPPSSGRQLLLAVSEVTQDQLIKHKGAGNAKSFFSTPRPFLKQKNHHQGTKTQRDTRMNRMFS
jgi:hypothetical protein